MSTVVIPVPASKSLSHRALMLSGLACGPSRLEGLLESEDTKLTREVMGAFGARYERLAPGAYAVTGIGPELPRGGDISAPLSLFVGESGTTCRLVTAIAAAGTGAFRIHGSGRMHDRPIGELVGALARLGACVSFEAKENCPPLLLEAVPPNRPAKLENSPGGMLAIGCDESSQYLSGLLLAAPLLGGLDLLLGGKKAVSWPYVGLTLDAMSRFGALFSVEVLTEQGWRECDWRSLEEAVPGGLRFRVQKGSYTGREYFVEGDWSGASYFLAAGAIGPKPVCVEGLNVDSLQGDASIIDILRLMGAVVETSDRSVTVYPSDLHGVDVDMGHCPDLVPTVAALAAHARGTTVVRNVAHLAIKESDRIAAPATELAKAGCRVTPSADGLVVTPPEHGPQPPAEGEIFSAHNDHRIAMSLSLLGLAGRQGRGFAVRLDNPACVAKSFPDFWRLWERVRA